MSQPLKVSTDSLLVLLALLLVSSYNLVLSASGSSFSSIGTKQHLQAGVEQEVDALLKWKSSLVNQTHSLLPSWKINSTRSTTSPCKWYGITCNKDGGVTELKITALGLEGTRRKQLLGGP
ncbi:hypothetical protein MKX03_019194 [Papaver bracteatum]|nr:hypothetical protein MKX03_019194 [Papaver bracteatum]